MLPVLTLALCIPATDPAPVLKQQPNTWVKRSPRADAPPSPGLGYEASLVWDSKHRRVIRFAGHNQGGGGEQNAETWVLDPLSAKWELKEPNRSPPGACCNQQNVFDADQGRMLRFPAFSGSHGWHWFRENYLNNSTVWSYDLATNTWRDRRPAPAPRVAPLRCASWDSDFNVVVVFGGEGSREGTLVYDPYTNTWHKLKPKDEPDPRSGGNMAYDPVNKLHVLFGSQFGNDPATWTFDLKRNEWRAHRPQPSPPADRNDAVLAYDHASRRVIAVVRVIDKSEKKEAVAGHLETWAFDAAKLTWTRMDPDGEPDGWGNRRRILVAAPELNALVLEAFVTESEKVPGVKREQQVWTYRGAAAVKPEEVQPPQNVRVWCDSAAAMVEFDRSLGPQVLKYRIVRGEGPSPLFANYTEVNWQNGDNREFRFRDQDPGKKPVYYRVQAIGRDSVSAFSPVVCNQPRVIDDLYTSIVDEKRVSIYWAMPPDPDAGYHVERAPVEVFSEDQLVRLKKDTPPLAEPSVGAIKAIGKFERITKEPLSTKGFGKTTAGTTLWSFDDGGIDLAKPSKVEGEASYTHRFGKEQIDPAGKPYWFGVHAYRVIAVNKLGVESGPSAWVLTIPAAVEQVFAKEEGTKCHLKWKAQFRMKYRVYRMDGPRINGPGQKVVRLTEKSIDVATFTDETKDTDTKRYWIVPVDKLGQEGIPSAPAWGWRQYRKVYENFTGEWHQ